MNPFKSSSFGSGFRQQCGLLFLGNIAVCLFMQFAFHIAKEVTADDSQGIIDDYLVVITWYGVAALIMGYSTGVLGGMLRCWNQDKKNRNQWFLVSGAALAAVIVGLLGNLLNVLFIRQFSRLQDTTEGLSRWALLRYWLPKPEALQVSIPIILVSVFGLWAYWRYINNEYKRLKPSDLTVLTSKYERLFRCLHLAVWFSVVLISCATAWILVYCYS